LALQDELRDDNLTITILYLAGMPTTVECISVIEAQRIIRQLTTEDVGKAANKTIEAAMD